MPADERARFMEAAQDEVDSLVENCTWVLVPRPQGQKVLDGKWVLTRKRDEKGQVVRHKARWVARGFMQQEGIDFTEIFANTVNRSTIKVVICKAVEEGWPLRQLDVKTAFLNPEIDHEVYVEQPTGFEDGGGRVGQLH